MTRPLALHLGVIAVLLAANWLLPAYHHTNLARIMVMAVFAMGYNIAFGTTGLLSLGHALFFAAGMYATGMGIHLLAIPTGPALALGRPARMWRPASSGCPPPAPPMFPHRA